MNASAATVPRLAWRLYALAAPGAVLLSGFLVTVWAPTILRLPVWTWIAAVLVAILAGVAAHRIGEPEGLAMVIAAVNRAAAVFYGVPLLGLAIAHLCS